MAIFKDDLEKLGLNQQTTPLMVDQALLPKEEIPAPSVAPQEIAPQPQLSSKEQYIADNTLNSPKIVNPGRPDFSESPLERADRIKREEALNERIQQAKINYDKALTDASDRELKQSIFAALGNYLPQAVAGATAMRTKASVKPPDLPKIAVQDLQGKEDRKFKTDYENILAQYKQLSSGQLNAKDRARLGAQYDNMYLTSQAIQGNMDARYEAQKNKAGEQLEKKVENLGKATENNSRAYNALGQIDDVLAEAGIPNIDSLKVKDGKVTGIDDKAVDLPGVSIPGLGRVVIGNDKAQTLSSAMSRVFNTELKDRSGAAVTDTELNRLREEFGQGEFNTESQMISALQRYKIAAAKALRNAEARYEKAVVEEYKQRGGTTSDSFAPKNAAPAADDAAFEAKMEKALKANPGATRAQIEEALKKKK